MSAEYRVFEEATDIWKAMEERWRSIARRSIEERGVFTVALSGGHTPVGFYCHLSRREDLPWDRTEIFQVDERFVPASSDESNARMIRSSILEGAPVHAERVHLIDTDRPTAAAAAADYEALLRSFFPPGTERQGRAPFDLILLGIGEDGHTASLFPGSPELKEKDRLVTAVCPEGVPRERITLTLPVLNSARNVFFLATGKKKAEVIAAIRDGKTPALPAALVEPESGNAVFYLDRFAGANIKMSK